jgi:hypothetical protein
MKPGSKESRRSRRGLVSGACMHLPIKALGVSRGIGSTERGIPSLTLRACMKPGSVESRRSAGACIRGLHAPSAQRRRTNLIERRCCCEPKSPTGLRARILWQPHECTRAVSRNRSTSCCGGKFSTCPCSRHGLHKLKTRGHWTRESAPAPWLTASAAACTRPLSRWSVRRRRGTGSVRR